MVENLNQVHEKRKSFQDRISDGITSFAGSLKFVYTNALWFGIWILVNLGIFSFAPHFDPYPFGLLTLIVSLEAIFLSTFVMISQNREAQREKIRAELDYQTDLRAEKEITEIKSVLEAIAKEFDLELKNGEIIKKKK